jgi:hypothetical protein
MRKLLNRKSAFAIVSAAFLALLSEFSFCGHSSPTLTSSGSKIIPPGVYRRYHRADAENHRPNRWEDQVDKRMQETEVREYLFEDDGRIPNNPTLPLLVYPQALDSSEQDSSRCKELLAENDWSGAWVNGSRRNTAEWCMSQA